MEQSNNIYQKTFTKRFFEIAAINQLEPEDLSDFNVRNKAKLLLGGIKHADAIVKGSKSLGKDVEALIGEENKPSLDYLEDENELAAAMVDFYKGLFEKVS